MRQTNETWRIVLAEVMGFAVSGQRCRVRFGDLGQDRLEVGRGRIVLHQDHARTIPEIFYGVRAAFATVRLLNLSEPARALLLADAARTRHEDIQIRWRAQHMTDQDFAAQRAVVLGAEEDADIEVQRLQRRLSEIDALGFVSGVIFLLLLPFQIAAALILSGRP